MIYGDARGPMPIFLQAAMLEYCDTLIASRKPDVTIGDESNPYVHRWWLGPHGKEPSAYLHVFYRDDYDGALHDHRYANTSVILRNSYWEHFHKQPLVRVGDKYETVRLLRQPGDMVQRPAALAHRVELVDKEKPVTTIFYTGREERRWGFDHPDGWMYWKDYNAKYIGRPNGNYREAT